MTECYLAVSIGGSRLSAGVVDEYGQVLVRDRIGLPAREVWHGVRRLVLRVLAASPYRPVACGVGCAGPMNPVERTVSPLRIPSWVDFPLAEYIAEATDLPVVVDNDGKMMALGEHWCGAAAGVETFIGIQVGTGIGGGIVCNGDLLDGRLGNAGHIGHVIVDPGGRPCVCGAAGCLEAYASGAALEAESGRSALRASASIVERSGLLVGRAIASVAALVDLQLAVVGGAVALGFGDPFFDAANAEVAARAKLAFLHGLRVVPAQLGPAAPLIGAAALAQRVVSSDPERLVTVEPGPPGSEVPSSPVAREPGMTTAAPTVPGAPRPAAPGGGRA